MSTNLPTVVPDREQLTELEARRIGDSAYRLAKLRHLQKEAAGSFHLSAKVTGSYGSGTSTYVLSPLDAEAVLALLLEREALFLASFNVEISPSPNS